ncbi:hypothetical protein [Bradyrhizobium australafricanum]|uniref:hypothetical protein n=1 Tax=Bradyrhizobium australafricanum TaxID=2821406 RepID=UPI001CE2BA26|nr:hypothetical protein [Bradyrhizobium australafricanum]MCA6098860.1 hypothetical protein [Bradyrhizobium australafricanum]
MTVELAGRDFFLAPGDKREFPDAEALRLIAAEYAVAVSEQDIERAIDINPAIEIRRRGRPRKAA